MGHRLVRHMPPRLLAMGTWRWCPDRDQHARAAGDPAGRHTQWSPPGVARPQRPGHHGGLAYPSSCLGSPPPHA